VPDCAALRLTEAASDVLTSLALCLLAKIIGAVSEKSNPKGIFMIFFLKI
jgi:hypothetical protein